MTRVCLVGNEDCNLQYELLSRETSREALAAYDLHEPFANSMAVDTVSLGAAVALLNDLSWYLVRFVEESLVLEPSISDEEYLSGELAAAIRDDAIDPEDSDRFLKVFGLETASGGDEDGTADSDATDRSPRLVEPMFVTRTGDRLPEYDLRDVSETVTVRVTESEFGA